MFGSNHTVRNTLGAIAVGGVSLFSAFSAAGQQVANLDAERQAYMSAQCGHIPNAARRVGCNAEAGLRFDENRITENQKAIAASQKSIAEANKTTAAAQRESAALRTENTCQQTLIGMIKNGKKEEVRAAYAGRPVNSVSACEIINSLTKG